MTLSAVRRFALTVSATVGLLAVQQGCAQPGASAPADALTTDAAVSDDTTSLAKADVNAPPQGSAGCGKVVDLVTQEWVAQAVDVAGVTREYWVWLPATYDSARVYPVVYQWHGCSSNAERQNNNVPVHKHSGEDAIIVRGRALENCWDTSGSGPTPPFFDALTARVESDFCADTNRRFVAGYSSGSFVAHRLACLRGDAIAGVATIAGGQGNKNCVGATAALLVHDSDDGTVDIGASEAARDSHLQANGCGAATTASEPSPCVTYQGCNPGLPVVWCQTNGQNHSRQDGLTGPAFWAFFDSL